MCSSLFQAPYLALLAMVVAVRADVDSAEWDYAPCPVNLLQVALQVQENISVGVAAPSVHLNANAPLDNESLNATPVATTPPPSTSNAIALYGLVWVLLCVLGYLIYQRYYKKYLNLQKRSNNELESTFYDYMTYKFSLWFVWTKRSKEVVLGTAFLLSILIVSTIYRLFVGSSIGTSLYQTFNMLVDPGGAQAQPTFAGQVIGVPASLIGLLIFAVLLAVVQDSFNNYLEDLKQGSSPVIENDHILVIGFTSDTLALLEELTQGLDESNRSNTIVVLADMDKADVETQLEEADLKGMQIVVRSGLGNKVEDLRLVSAETCSQVVLMPDRKKERNLRDAFTMHALMALCSQGWPKNGGRILAPCASYKNKELFEKIGGDNTDIVELDCFLGNLLVECSNSPGIGSIYQVLFGFDHQDLYIVDAPARLHGLTFGEASVRFDRAILVGVMQDGRNGEKNIPKLCPGNEYKIQKTDAVVMLMERQPECLDDFVTSKPCAQAAMVSEGDEALSPSHKKVQEPDRILIFGWNELIGSLLFALDGQCAAETTISIIAPKCVDERDKFIDRITDTSPNGGSSHRTLSRQFSIAEKIQKIKIENFEGSHGTRASLEEHKEILQAATKVFILADNSVGDGQSADTYTMAAVLQARDLLQGSGRHIPIVPEISNFVSEDLCHNMGLTNFVDSAHLRAQVLASIALQPRIAPVLFDLTAGGEGTDLYLARLEDFMPGGIPEEGLTWWSLSRTVSEFGGVLVGWSLPDDDDAAVDSKTFKGRMNKLLSTHVEGSGLNFDLNPEDKNSLRSFSTKDRIVTIQPSSLADKLASPRFRAKRAGQKTSTASGVPLQ